MEVMRFLLADQGYDLDRLWLDHLAQLAYYDFYMGGLIQEYVSYYDGYPESANQLVAEHWSEGTGGLLDPPEATLPMRYGFNSIRLYSPSPERYLFQVVGEAKGSAESPSSYGARLVLRSSSGSVESVELPFDGAEAELEVEIPAGTEELTLIVGAWTELHYRMDREVFPYQYSITPAEPLESDELDEDVSPVKESGCFKPASLSLFFMPLALYGSRRRGS